MMCLHADNCFKMAGVESLGHLCSWCKLSVECTHTHTHTFSSAQGGFLPSGISRVAYIISNHSSQSALPGRVQGDLLPLGNVGRKTGL